MIRLFKKDAPKSTINKEVNEHLNIVKEIPFFQNLDRHQLVDFIKAMKSVTYQPGDCLLTEGEAVDGVYFIKEGEVQVFVTNTQTGKQELITHGYAGECFGEMASLRANANASATVLAGGQSVVLYIDRTNFLQLVNRYNLWASFTEVMADRLDKTNHRMTEIMKHVKQGMVEVDREGIVTGKFSMGFVNLLGCKTNEINKKSLVELLFKDCQKSKKYWEENFKEIFTTPMNQMTLILGLLPAECIYFHPEKGKRYYELSYDICIYQGKIDGLDISLEDITIIKELDAKSRAWEAEKRIIQEIYTNSETFRSLLNLIEIVEENINDIVHHLKQRTLTLNDLRYYLGNVHSLKGTSRFLQLDEIGDEAHRLENLLIDVRSQISRQGEFLESFRIQSNELRKKMQYVNQILDRMSDETRRRLTADLILTKQEVSLLHREIKNNKNALVILMNAQRISSDRLVEGWDKELKRICIDSMKNIQFKIIGESLSIPGKINHHLKIPILHLLRNCAAHGIEIPAKRELLKKSRSGLITFQTSLGDGFYNFCIEDDGAGINKNDVIQTAKLLAEKTPQLKDRVERLIKSKNIISLLFLPGFSTSIKTSDLSGRGIGLDVVQRAVKKIGGRIIVQTKLNSGTKFEIQIPN